MKRRLALRLIGAGLAVAAAALAASAYLAYAPAGDASQHPFNRDRNAVWLEHRWLERTHPEQEMEALFASLEARGILYAFPHMIPFDADGRLPEHDREQVRAFLRVARSTAPGLKLLPWVGGLRVGHRRTRAGRIDLADLAQRQRLVAECRGLIDEGFDGVHLNIEPLDDGNVEYLALLRALKTAVGKRLLSVSAIRPGPLAPPGAPNFFWTAGYYERVAASADQIVLMAYDTALPTPALYRRYLAYAASTVTAALERSGSETRLLVGVPTYDGTGLMHRGDVETLENALLGVVAGLRGTGASGTFEGVALYAEWTTDAEEWAAYERIWRRRDAALEGGD